MRATRITVAVMALLFGLAPGVAYAQVVTTPPTEPPTTSPPATDPPEPEPTTPVTDPPTATTSPSATSPPTTRPRTTVTRARGTTTSSTTKPGPTTTLFVIPGEAGPTTSIGPTTLATIPQNDEIPTWATNLFWVGIAGMLTIVVTTYVMSGRDR